MKYNKKQLNDKVSYTVNNCIINSKIYELLISLKYKFNDAIKKADLFFIGYRKILLLFQKIDINKDNDEIGFVNKDDIFIPEYILEFINNEISYDNINKFLINDFLKIISDKTEEKNEIKNNNNKLIGYFYKISNIQENDVNINNNSYVGNKNKIPHNTSKTLNNSENLNTIDSLQKNENIYKKINPYIELMINIYMFKEDYTKKITNTLSQSNEETNFCIRKKWLDKFKTHFDYNKFNSIIKEGDIYKIIKEYNYNNNYNKFLEDLMQLCPNYFTNKINELSNNKENIRKYFNNEPISLELKENNKIYYYNDEIEIINKKTKDLIQELFDISNNGKYNKFLFGDRKIIMEFNIKSQYSIIIGKYNDNYFVQDILLIFGSEEDMKYYFEKVHKDGYISITKDLDLQKNLLHYSNIVGKAFYIKDLDNNNIKDINDEEAITDIASFNKENITFSNIDNQNIMNDNKNII